MSAPTNATVTCFDPVAPPASADSVIAASPATARTSTLERRVILSTSACWSWVSSGASARESSGHLREASSYLDSSDVDGKDQDSPDDDELVEGRQALDHEPGLEDHGQERAEHGSGDGHAAPEEVRAADHRAGDRRQRLRLMAG